jgi:putative membrane protein
MALADYCRGMKTQSLPTSSSRSAFRYAACVTVSLMAGILSTPAATPPDRPPTAPVIVNKVELKGSDKDFAEKVAKASMEEVEVSRVAADRSLNPQIKAFAETMKADHSRLNDELSAIAASKGVSLPAKDRTAEKWMKQDAKDFDRDYVKKMVADHEDTVKVFQKQATEGEDADLVAFARKHLPAVQKHLEHANDLERLLK